RQMRRRSIGEGPASVNAGVPAPRTRMVGSAAMTEGMHAHPTVQGFRFAGVSCGIKEKGALDLGLIVAEEPVAAAGVFTRNRVKAAPVLVATERLERGRARAVLVNSGNANACTGKPGLAAVRETTRALADELEIEPELVLPASTG